MTIPRPHQMSGQQLVKTEGCYVGVFDALSPINVAGRLSSFMRAANQEAATAGQQWASLYYFNDCWVEAMRRGDILAWIVVFDGVFKVAATVLEPDAPGGLPSGEPSYFLGREDHPLSCPSGRIIVASLGDLGSQTLQPIVVVEPGTYHVALTVDEEQEGAHAFLDDVAQYPGSDGPDWSLRIWST